MENLNSVWSSIVIYWFDVQETFLMIINVENSYCLYLCGNHVKKVLKNSFEEQ